MAKTKKPIKIEVEKFIFLGKYMNNKENGISGLNILVCGSQKFDDKSFVFGMLDQFYQQSQGQIKQVFTSAYSGTCEFAREWVKTKNEQILNIAREHGHKNPPLINQMDCTFDMHLMQRNSSLYEQIEIPHFMLQHDPFYIKGAEMIAKNNINLVLAFPNAEGVLGPATYNINRFAKLAGIGNKILDCSDALRQLVEFRKSEQANMETQQSNGFTNKHPGKKF